MRASKAAREFLQWASEKHRVECELPELWVSTKCGESDTTSGCGANPTVGDAFDKLYAKGCTLVFGETTELTGGEQIVAARCRDDRVRADFMRVFDRYQQVIERHKTSDLSDSQPTKGNIAGGLTTIEEKALGNIQKIGRQCVVDGVLDKAEVPRTRDCGSWTRRRRRPRWSRCARPRGSRCTSSRPARATSSATPFFRSSRFAPIRAPVRTMSEHIDVDTSGLLQREITMSQAGDKLIDMMFRTANGRLTAAEALGHREFGADPALRERLMDDRLALPDIAAIRAARERIAPHVRVTPVMRVGGARRDPRGADLPQVRELPEGRRLQGARRVQRGVLARR